MKSDDKDDRFLTDLDGPLSDLRSQLRSDPISPRLRELAKRLETVLAQKADRTDP
ncbi:hypothetical protein [Paracoccus sp. (in: a-proteobacteria)]|uniref:hypothetical protein n=1 Tax=Paracoccus sp. TaxID=267 RepID=UPI00396CAC6F